MRSESRRSFLSRLAQPEDAPPWSGLTVALTIGAAFVAVLAASGFVFTWLGTVSAAPFIAWSVAALLTILFIVQTRRTPADREALHLRGVNNVIPLLLAINIALAMAADLPGLALNGGVLPQRAETAALSPGADVMAWVFAALLLVVVQPIADGLVFSGIAFPRLRANLGPWPGLLLTVGLFGVFHALVYPALAADGSPALWQGLIVPLLHGLIFTLNRAYTGSTRDAILAQAVVGLFELFKVAMLAR